MFEKIKLAANSAWCLEARQETWLLVVMAMLAPDSFDLATGDVVFAQADRVNLHVGAAGMVGLVAYTGGEQAPHLLEQPRTIGRHRDN